MRVIKSQLQSTHQADEQAKPPGIITEDPDTICVEKSDRRRHYKFHNRNVDRGRKMSSEAVMTRGDPVIHVGISERYLELSIVHCPTRKYPSRPQWSEYMTCLRCLYVSSMNTA